VWVYAAALLIGILPSGVLGLAFAFCIDGLIRVTYTPHMRIRAVVIGAAVPLVLCGTPWFLPRAASHSQGYSGALTGFTELFWASRPEPLILMMVSGAALGLIVQNRFDRFTSITTPESVTVIS
jgi:hypothetical protein